jgi:hypothetical protein
MKNKTILFYIFALIIGIGILFLIEQVRPKEEAFTGTITFCPKGWQPFYDNNGDMECCDGEVKGNQCQGIPKCTFGKGTANMPNCTGLQTAYAAEKSKNVCPASMPNYYETANSSGCTAGPLASDLTGPAVSTQASCINYSDDATNRATATSCLNQRRLEAVTCFGKDCYKSIYVSPLSKTALVQVDFTDLNGVRRSTITRDSYKDYLDATDPDWQSKIDLNKSITVTEVAKAVFVDRTMDIAQAQV